MPDKKILVLIAVMLLAVGGLIYWGVQDSKQAQVVDDPNAIVYYWGDGCPHCKVVSDFLDANPQVAEKVSFEKKEVWSNKANASEMGRRAKVCNINQEGMGVPFLYGGDGKCYVGQVEVIDFFKTKSGMSTEPSTETQN